jgi:hypothetical protein
VTETELNELQKLADAATPGPWFVDGCSMCCGVSQGSSYRDRGHAIDGGAGDWLTVDATFVAKARTAVPALIAEVRRLRSVLKGCEDALTERHAEIARLMAELDMHYEAVEEANAEINRLTNNVDNDAQNEGIEGML